MTTKEAKGKEIKLKMKRENVADQQTIQPISGPGHACAILRFSDASTMGALPGADFLPQRHLAEPGSEMRLVKDLTPSCKDQP
jgi:hypothetical protein